MKIRLACLFPFLLSVAVLFQHVGKVPALEPEKTWPAEVERALNQAGSNRPTLEKALKNVPAEQKKGLEFLIANMPDTDLRSLREDFLLENLAFAYRAKKQVSWGEKIPEEIFFNNVLPYANVDESRDPWRKELYDLCMPLVKDCKTSSEAVHILNSKVFEKLKVRYSTQRKKPQQSPKESIETGMASCTGLSILLSDACRSVGIPTRVVGTPLWTNKRGNHTWLEIWDGRWRFTGACEPDPKGLDHGWFIGDAAQAKKNTPEHAIYAASFRRTKVVFPLVWAPDQKDVFAENITERYAREEQKKEPQSKATLTPEQAQLIEKEALRFFSTPEEKQTQWTFDPKLDALLKLDEAGAKRSVWKAYQTVSLHEKLKRDFDDKQVRFKEHLSPYTVREVGKKPKAGWPLVLAMHGGGNAPKTLNDSQWKVMQTYYKDQPSVAGYKYLALRAPNDTWNGFYDNYVPPLIENLLRQFALFGEIDTNKVFLMGYSHGGYGAFFLGPKIPDRFAAVHCSASAPTDGTISPQNLRNTRFTFMIGELDTDYGRRERCENFDKEIQKLRAENKGDYPVEMEFKKGIGHGGLPDRDKIKSLYEFTRNPVPGHVTWELTDSVIGDFFWLSVPKPEGGQKIDARIQGNHIQVTTRKVKRCELNLDGWLINFEKPLQVEVDGKSQEFVARPSLLTLCQSINRRADIELSYTCRISIDCDKK